MKRIRFTHWHRAVLISALLMSLLGSLWPATPAYATASYLVTKTADTADGTCNADCSLREAITAANANPGTVTVPAGTYTLTLAGSGENANASGDLDVTGSMTINGAGAGQTIIQAGTDETNGIDRVLQVHAGTFYLSGVTLAFGRTSEDGGAVWVGGTSARIEDSIISSSTSAGALYNYGGGIYVAGTLLLSRSLVVNNYSAGYGGGIYVPGGGTLTLANSTIADNQTTNYGGGLYNWTGVVSIINSTFSGNIADQGLGGGIYSYLSLGIENTILANSVGSDCNAASGISPNTNNLFETYNCTATLHGDPALGPLADNGGPTPTFALLIDSPAVDAGDDAVCANANTVNNLDQRGVSRPVGQHCDIGAYESPFLRVTSVGGEDGWILESAENSLKGGTLNAGSDNINLGDDRSDKQYRGILSFDTSSLPDDAVVLSATIKFLQSGVSGTNPMKTHGKLVCDIRSGFFGSSSALALGDFKAAASLGSAATFPNAPVDGWYTGQLGASALGHVNRTGLTQCRLRFTKDDNDDGGADVLKIYSGNYSMIDYRPVLVVEFSQP